MHVYNQIQVLNAAIYKLIPWNTAHVDYGPLNTAHIENGP